MALLFSTIATAQTQTFNFAPTSSGSGIYQSRTITGDVNNDGREDFVATQQVNSPLPGFTVQLSNGDGTYAPPQSYQLPDSSSGMAYDIVLADVNSDGWLDIVVTQQTNGFLEYLNNGDGTFRLQARFAVPVARTMAVGDFNHDGHPDLIFDCAPGYTSTQLCVFFGNGDNGFDVGPTTTLTPYYGSDILMGDFDGDGKADVALVGAGPQPQTTNVTFLFGDNTGHFQTTNQNTDLASLQFRVADLNGDGKSDLIGSPMNTQNGGPTNFLIYYRGNAARTADHLTIPLSDCSLGRKAAIADLNGDGIPDIAYTQLGGCGTAQAYNLAIKYGNGDGTFATETLIYSSSTPFYDVYPLRANQDTKPDLAVIHFTSSNPQTELIAFLNMTASGSFPTCNPLNRATGINICSPQTTAPSGSVHFAIGAAGQTDMRKVEVWVDGNKVAEQKKDAFSHYAFLDADVAIADGNHNVDIFVAGWDNLLQHNGFTLTVGGTTSGGGTGSCPQPFGPGVNICSPAQGSTVTSPFTISASGKNSNGTAGMDVWLDGTKVGWYGNTTTVNIQVSAGAGSHQLDIYAIGTDGQKEVSTVTFTVGSSTSGGSTGGGTGGSTGGTCTQPSSAGVNICSPTKGSTVTSPVTISAAGRNSGTTDGMDVWIDGKKFGWFPGTTVNAQATLAAGSHQLDIYAVGTNGELKMSSVTFTVGATSSGGTGGSTGGSTTCSARTSPGVTICTPTEGSTQNSPVTIEAYGMNNGSTDGMDVYIDGHHTGWYGSTTHISISVALASGSHQLDVYAVGTNGELQESTVHFSVP